MTTTPRPSREIDGKGRTVRELLAGRKYSIDYYQREYNWQQKQVTELLDDLATKFLESHEDGNERSAVADDGDLPYADKREHYAGQNLLARSLHERAYDHNPRFRRFLDESGLSFRAHAEFRKADLDARQVLYQTLAERIWSPERLAQEAAS
jgi:hypothetical protein